MTEELLAFEAFWRDFVKECGSEQAARQKLTVFVVFEKSNED